MGARIRHVIVETLLWAAAAIGFTCIVLVISAYVFNISLIMFRTGSMEPTIPAGSVAVVQEIPAADVGTGDVLTVDRPGQLPVTHRVTSVELTGVPGERLIRMQGDANEVEDPAPYVITEARKVLVSVPQAAHMINQLGSPYVLGPVTVGASVLVVWAFWPRKFMSSSPRASSGRSMRRAPMRTDQPSEVPRARRQRRHSSLLGLAAPVMMGTALVLLTPQHSHAQEDEDIVHEVRSGQHLTLHSTYRVSQREHMAPGNNAVWDIALTSDAPTPGRVRIGLGVYGDFPFDVTIQRCTRPWEDVPESEQASGLTCSPDAHVLMQTTLVGPDDDVQWFYEYPVDDEQWLRIVTTVPDGTLVEPQTTSLVRLYAEGQAGQDAIAVDGNAVQSTPTPSYEASRIPVPESASSAGAQDSQGGALAITGASYLWLVVLAICTVIVGRVLQSRFEHSRGESTVP